MRREGRTPAVIYGDKKEPLNISVTSNNINVEYNKGHMYTTLCDVDIEGEKHLVLARDVQLHPVTDIVEHADFLRVTKKTQIPVFIAVHFVGEEECPGLKEGGVLNVSRHEIELLCSAMSIPDAIEVNIANKETGDAVKLSDAILPEGVSPVIEGRDFNIASIQIPKVVSEETEEEAAEGGEAAEGDEAQDDKSEADSSSEE